MTLMAGDNVLEVQKILGAKVNDWLMSLLRNIYSLFHCSLINYSRDIKLLPWLVSIELFTVVISATIACHLMRIFC